MSTAEPSDPTPCPDNASLLTIATVVVVVVVVVVVAATAAVDISLSSRLLKSPTCLMFTPCPCMYSERDKPSRSFGCPLRCKSFACIVCRSTRGARKA